MSSASICSNILCVICERHEFQMVQVHGRVLQAAGALQQGVPSPGGPHRQERQARRLRALPLSGGKEQLENFV